MSPRRKNSTLSGSVTSKPGRGGTSSGSMGCTSSGVTSTISSVSLRLTLRGPRILPIQGQSDCVLLVIESLSRPARASVWPARSSTVVVTVRVVSPGMPLTVVPVSIWLNSGETLQANEVLVEQIGREADDGAVGDEVGRDGRDPADAHDRRHGELAAGDEIGRLAAHGHQGRFAQQADHAVLFQIGNAEAQLVVAEVADDRIGCSTALSKDCSSSVPLRNWIVGAEIDAEVAGRRAVQLGDLHPQHDLVHAGDLEHVDDAVRRVVLIVRIRVAAIAAPAGIVAPRQGIAAPTDIVRGRTGYPRSAWPGPVTHLPAASICSPRMKLRISAASATSRAWPRTMIRRPKVRNRTLLLGKSLAISASSCFRCGSWLRDFGHDVDHEAAGLRVDVRIVAVAEPNRDLGRSHGLAHEAELAWASIA